MRYLILAIALYILYRIVKKLFAAPKASHKGPEGEIVDELVQDAFCKIYVPRRQSVEKVIEGRPYFFCSRECADRFENERRAQSM